MVESSNIDFPVIYHSLVDEIRLFTGGHPPFLVVSNDPLKIGAAFLSQPVFYPSIVVPQSPDSDWRKVGYGLIHLLRSLKGIPMLAVHGTKADVRIASDIDNEIEYLAICNELSRRRLPAPAPISNLPNLANNMMENISDDTLPEHITFRALQLCHRLDSEGAKEALTKVANSYPANVNIARELHREIKKCNLSTASGKESACQLVVKGLGFKIERFYMREFGISKGKNLRFGLGHYQAIENWKNRIINYYDTARSYVEFDLPFSIPVKDGLYSYKDACLLIEHIESENPRATWQSNNVTVEPQIDQSGLYGISKISMLLAGAMQPEPPGPPVEPIYRIFQSYSPLLHQVLEIMNGFLDWTRIEYKRPDTPNITLLHFNRVSIKVFDADGRIICNIPMQSNEYAKISSGPPTAPPEGQGIEPAYEVEFYLQLLEQAKLNCIETNPRRAVIDIFSAFESFVSYYLSPKLDSISETTKQRFIRLYKNKLNEKILSTIELTLKDINDEAPLSVTRIVKEYRRRKCTPELNKKYTEEILRVVNLRNDAAHGRELPIDTLDQVANAIEAFERVSSKFGLEKKGVRLD